MGIKTYDIEISDSNGVVWVSQDEGSCHEDGSTIRLSPHQIDLFVEQVLAAKERALAFWDTSAAVQQSSPRSL